MLKSLSKMMASKHEDIEIIEYMLKVIGVQLLELMFIFLVATLFGVLNESIMVTFSFFISRMFIFKNNWHSKNMYFCITVSTISIVGASILASLTNNIFSIMFGFILVAITQKKVKK